ncbi:hypothetical protein DM01DRAFT_1383960 [Hesseltinella vesiculosa]|uniref:arginine--tRNA ligase n=1 Tax=Hesseltinella vesiculosa TaxID=101127 RepID=A0A1X2GGV7_9FUNG|nr:hypothetical protein DM01DRAFT_1383960 [Hesseltinella vesiculosa]
MADPREVWQSHIAQKLHQLLDRQVQTDTLIRHLQQPRHSSHGQFALPLHAIQPLLTLAPWVDQSMSDNAIYLCEKFDASPFIETLTAQGNFVNVSVPKETYIAAVLQPLIQTPFHLPETPACLSIDVPVIPQLYQPHHTRALFLATFFSRCHASVDTHVILCPLILEFGNLALALELTGGCDNAAFLSTYLTIKNDPSLVSAAVALRQQLEMKDPLPPIQQQWSTLRQWVQDQRRRLLSDRLRLRMVEVDVDRPPWELVDQLTAKITCLPECLEGTGLRVDLTAYDLGKPWIKDDQGLLTRLGECLLLALLRPAGTSRHLLIAGQHQERIVQQANCLLQRIHTHRTDTHAPNPSEPCCLFTHVHFRAPRTLPANDNNTSPTLTSIRGPQYLPNQLDHLQHLMQDIMQDNQGTDKYATVLDHFRHLSLTTATPVTTLAQQHADQLGRATLLIHFLMQRRCKPVGPLATPALGHRQLQVHGNSGVFLLYVHARICGIQRYLTESELLFANHTSMHTRSLDQPVTNADADHTKTNGDPPDGLLMFGCSACLEDTLGQVSMLATSSETFEMVELLALFPTVLQQCMAALEPHPLVSYLFKLARLTNQALYNQRIKGVPVSLALPRWLLFCSVKLVLERAFDLLGIEPVGWM